jgi:hypothetical protein
MNHHTNEVRRIIADFSNLLIDQAIEREAYPLGGESRLFIVGDEQPDGSIRFSLIGDGPEWAYRLISELCEYRSVEAEYGRLLANGRRLPAEKYLGLWRDADKQRLPLDKLIAAGITPVMHASLPTPACRKEEESAAWFASPLFVGGDDAVSSWIIPLDRLDHLVLAAQLTRVYCDREQFNNPALGRTYRLRVDEANAAAFAGKEGAPATPALGTISGNLFAEAA